MPDAAPLRALSGVHTLIVVIRESGLTIIVLELELDDGCCHLANAHKFIANLSVETKLRQ